MNKLELTSFTRIFWVFLSCRYRYCFVYLNLATKFDDEGLKGEEIFWNCDNCDDDVKILNVEIEQL